MAVQGWGGSWSGRAVRQSEVGDEMWRRGRLARALARRGPPGSQRCWSGQVDGEGKKKC